MNCIN